MARTITVKGVGKASVKPDQVEITISLEAKDKDYDKAMTLASEQIGRIKAATENAGFEKDCLKTTAFNVRTSYDNIRDKHQNYVRIFEGYVCSHTLRLAFDFETTLLASALNAITKSQVNPELEIAFTVKDPNAVNALILQDAAANAQQKAEILSAAAGVTLGNLINIDYNWGEISFLSRTTYDYADCLPAAAVPCEIDIEPDDIKAADSAAFTWEIL